MTETTTARARSRSPEGTTRDDLEPALVTALRSATARAVRSASRVTVLYSGGVDSSIVARLASEHAETSLLVVGLPGRPDLEAARTGAERLRLPLRAVELAPGRATAALERWAAATQGLTPTERDVAVATGLALEVAPDATVLCGQGADELFFGYSHFRALDMAEAGRRAKQDWQRLVDALWPASLGIARRLGKELASPYLDPGFVTSVGRVPVEARMPGAVPKELLRRVAVQLGVPEELARRPKRAFQYGSGVARELRASTPRRSRA